MFTFDPQYSVSEANYTAAKAILDAHRRDEITLTPAQQKALRRIITRYIAERARL